MADRDHPVSAGHRSDSDAVGGDAATCRIRDGPHGVSAVVLSQTTLNGQDYIQREITIDPGGSTGWHWHDGTLFGAIRQGTLTHNLADCSTDGSYGPGDSITESSGSDHVHIGRNLGPTGVDAGFLHQPSRRPAG
ncbi:MAG: cupin domain-containing protein [Mycobacterium sp.]